MSQRTPALDVVRAWCVIGVVTTHVVGNYAWDTSLVRHVADVAALGSFGVTGFFVLSSYLLTSILVREVSAGRPRIWQRYFTRRALRIWPLYFGVLIVSVLGALASGASVPAWGWLATFSYNWVSWRHPTASWLGHLWSVCAEEQLYLVIPVLSAVALRVRWKVLVIAIASAPALRWMVVGHSPYPAVWNYTTSHLDAFGLGMLLASLDAAGTERWARARRWLGSSRLAALTAAALSSGLAAAAWRSPSEVFGGHQAAITYLAATLCFTWLLLMATERGIGSPTRMTPLQWIGQRSYGIYVYHWPLVILGLQLHVSRGTRSVLLGFAVLGLTCLASEVSYRYVESPFLRLKERFSAS